MKFTDLLLMLVLMGFIVLCIDFYFSTPVVNWSTSSDECVRVMYGGTETDCNELPGKYEKVWVR